MMRILIHSHHLPLPADAGRFLAKHVARSIARLCDDQAAELTVWFEDERSRRGGVDRRCRMAFRMPHIRTLQLSSLQDDPYKAMLDATSRLKRLIQREVAKRRSPSGRVSHRPLARIYRGAAARDGVTADGSPSTL
jgi:ribosome-associated translation inhibitor RaiA